MRRAAGLTPPQALALAAVLVAVSLGIVWHANSATYGQTMPGYSTTILTHNFDTGGLDLTLSYMPGYHVDGDPTDGARGFESSVRLVLAPAIAVLLWVAARPTPMARRAAALVVYGLAGCALIAVSDRYVIPAIVCGAAALLVRWALSHPTRSVPVSAGSGPSSPATAF